MRFVRLMMIAMFVGGVAMPAFAQEAATTSPSTESATTTATTTETPSLAAPAAPAAVETHAAAAAPSDTEAHDRAAIEPVRDAVTNAVQAPPSQNTDVDIAGLPVHFQLGGYFRSRVVWGGGWPTARTDGASFVDPANAPSFGYMRARLEPAITYGPDKNMPLAALRMQMDLLDNVVFGDNARLSPTPLFASDPSSTSIDARDIPMVRIRRLWLEFNIPVGQIRIGRQASQGGMGLLFNDGNGFRNDFGDAQYGTTYDRVLFATRPITIFNAITKHDRTPTPLLFAIGHDWLAGDPLGVGLNPALDMYGQPSRSQIPFATLGAKNTVGQNIFVLAWNDGDLNPEQSRLNPNRPKDELNVGVIDINRTQASTNSNVWILDEFWKFRYSAFGSHAPALITNGEVYTIVGHTQAVALGMVLDGTTGRTPAITTANVWGAVAQIGVGDEHFTALLEGGYSSGDPDIFAPSGDHNLGQRAFNPDYHVGLLMYPVAMAVRTANAYGVSATPLWSGGGVWNSKYMFPTFRYRFTRHIEGVGAFLLAWADVLNEAYPSTVIKRAIAGNNSQKCGVFQADCFMGWEADVALKVNWGGEHNDLMRWSTEFGLMHAGGALAAELDRTLMWTLQSRIAMVF